MKRYTIALIVLAFISLIFFVDMREINKQGDRYTKNKEAVNDARFTEADNNVNKYLLMITENPNTEKYADSVSKYYYISQQFTNETLKH